MGPEAKFYQQIKRNFKELSFVRIENSSLLGTPDLLGYNINCTFFTVELKVARGNRITFSPHQIAFHLKHPKNSFICVRGQGSRSVKLFEGSKIRELSTKGLKLEPVATGFDEISKVLGSL